MNLTADQLIEVEEMAALFLSLSEIAINIEEDPEQFDLCIKSEQGPVFMAYMKGVLRTKIALRKSILSSALNGSSPAQQMMKEFEIKSKL